jgi:hypothetical protein
MITVVITKGAHARNVHMSNDHDRRHFAHQWDNDDLEDTAHQAHNFVTYATALGGYEPPVILLPGKYPEDPADHAHMNVCLADWASIVGSALDTEVEIR